MNTYSIILSATLGDDDIDVIMIIPILIEILMNIMVMMIHSDSSQSMRIMLKVIIHVRLNERIQLMKLKNTTKNEE